MSKKPLVRSKKRAVHTNTKDKLSKLIAQVDSIAKELSKVKKGGGFSFPGSKKENFFTKIGNMLIKERETILIMKYEFIDLLVDSYIENMNYSYDSFYNHHDKSFKIDNITIKDLIINLKTNMYEYNVLNVSAIENINNNNLEKINNMNKIAHILNIIKYLYQEVKSYSVRDVITGFDKKTHFTDLKINQILFDYSDNNKDFRYEFMGNLKNDLMKKVFLFVENINNESLIALYDKIKSVYESIQNKYIFSYVDLMKTLYTFDSFGMLGDIVSLNDNIKLLKRIKFKYNIYTKIICPESTNNLFIHEESYSKNIPFSFDNIYKEILEDDNINNIITLKEGIKLHKRDTSIKKNDSQRKKGSYMIDRLTATNNIKNAFTKGEFSKLFAKGNKKDPLNDIITNQKALRLNISDKMDVIKEKEASKTDEEKKLLSFTDKDNRKKIENIIDRLNIEITALNKELNALNNENEANIERLDIIKKELIKNYIADNKSTEKEAQEIFQSYIDSYEPQQAASEGGKLVAKYKSTGESVYILYKKKKIKRCVYEKTKGRGKYCKIDGEYKLLSKLKIM